MPTAHCCGGCAAGLVCDNGACRPPRCGEGAPCRVFVTSTRTTGNIGGLLRADAMCQAAANNSDRTSGGIYMAWLSHLSQSPATRFAKNPGPYVLVDDAKTIIAGNWTELTSGSLRNAIRVMETGLTVASVPWTGTLADGTPANPDLTCVGWTDDTFGASARVGRSTVTSSAWSDDSTRSCDELNRLYCFEQG